ncbi:MAG: hypothetical protein NC213_08300 [Acetobacter sp.]|nr:hypothetical protein [Bacteroides sp.]MCM1341730.1 hypothetical protein [Acetobacter sp.]MCM1432331.1 hypothetical protein [Clostridiales bacterium]
MENSIYLNEEPYNILQNALRAICCPRGKFYPDKNYGSKINASVSSLSDKQLLDYARQAVSDIDGVTVKSVDVGSKNIKFTILVNNERGQVSINL